MVHRSTLTILVLGAAVSCSWIAGPSWAEDHIEAKRLREAGKILSLEEIVRQASAQHSGRLIETELERRNGRYVYEIELIDPEGYVLEFYYDAVTGKLLDNEVSN